MLVDGNPETVAPQLFARLARLDQRAVAGSFQRRLELAGKSDPRHPDDEAASSVARKAFLQGTFVMFFFVRALPFLMIWSGAMSFVVHGEANSVSDGISIVAGTAVLALSAIWGLRVLEIFRAIPAARAPEPGAPAPTRNLAFVRAGILVLSTAVATLIVVPLYTGPLYMTLLYIAWFAALVQAVAWSAVTAGVTRRTTKR